jgi:hypothetical protein
LDEQLARLHDEDDEAQHTQLTCEVLDVQQHVYVFFVCKKMLRGVLVMWFTHSKGPLSSAARLRVDEEMQVT